MSELISKLKRSHSVSQLFLLHSLSVQFRKTRNFTCIRMSSCLTAVRCCAQTLSSPMLTHRSRLEGIFALDRLEFIGFSVVTGMLGLLSLEIGSD
jgi:hypothetical protein